MALAAAHPRRARNREAGAVTGPATRSEFTMRGFTRGDYLAAAIAAAGALAVYLATLAPTVSGEDSGELIAAAYTMGVPHPPGYPLWCLLGRLFTYVPLGSVAWRVNLSSAVCASAAVFLVALLVIHLTRNRLAAVGAALALAFSFEFWEQAVIAEVYVLNALIVAFCVLLLWTWRESRDDRLLILLGFVVGLGLANHNTMVLLAPLLAGFVVVSNGFSARNWRVYCAAMLATGAGLLVYVYLPLASMANPPMDWGNPETLQGWWDHVTRKQLSFMYWQYPRGAIRFARQLAACGEMWSMQFTVYGSVLAFVGLGLFLWRRTAYAVFTLLIGVVAVAGFALIQNFNFDKEWLWVMSVFGIPAYVMTALWIGVALDGARRRFGTVLAGAAACIAVALPLGTYWERNDRSDYYWAEDYGRNVLNQMAPDAVFIPETDHASFAAVYLQVAERLRRDVIVGRRYGYLAPEVFAEIPEGERQAQWGDKPFRRYEPEIFAALLRYTKRPIYFTHEPELPAGTPWRFVQEGLLFRAVPAGQAYTPSDPWHAYQWRNGLDPGHTHGDQTAEIILYEYHMARAREAFSSGDEKAALTHVEAANDAYGPDTLTMNNLGVLCAKFRQWEAAERFFREALGVDPDNETASANLKRVLRRGGG